MNTRAERRQTLRIGTPRWESKSQLSVSVQYLLRRDSSQEREKEGWSEEEKCTHRICYVRTFEVDIDVAIRHACDLAHLAEVLYVDQGNEYER